MKIKRGNNFFRSLRFRILIILLILGIAPTVIVTCIEIGDFEERAMDVHGEKVQEQCEILCNLLIRENYLNDSSSQLANSKLELLASTYDGRILLVDKDFRIVRDTYGTDEGKVLYSPLLIRCFKGEQVREYDEKDRTYKIAVSVKSPEVKKLQGAMLFSFSSEEVLEMKDGLRKRGILLIGIIVALSILLGYVLSTVLVKPFARITKAIEDLTDGYQNEEISVPDYT